MPTSVIVAGARTPIGRLQGGLARLHRRRSRCRRDRSHPRQGRRLSRERAVRDHGPGPHRRRRADARASGRGEGRHPDDDTLAQHQQGLPVRCRVDHPGRPVRPLRRVRRRRRRRHGVDEPGPAPAARLPRRLQVRRRHPRRPHGPRRPARCIHRPADGPAHRGGQRRRRDRPRAAGCVRGALARTCRKSLGHRGFRRRGGGRGDRRTPGREQLGAPGRRGARPRPRSRASRNCRRRSAPTAPSPPGTRRRSTTVPARWW